MIIMQIYQDFKIILLAFNCSSESGHFHHSKMLADFMAKIMIVHICFEQSCSILSVHKLSCGHVSCHKKCGPNRFSHFDVYWIQADR